MQTYIFPDNIWKCLENGIIVLNVCKAFMLTLERYEKGEKNASCLVLFQNNSLSK